MEAAVAHTPRTFGPAGGATRPSRVDALDEVAQVTIRVVEARHSRTRDALGTEGCRK